MIDGQTQEDAQSWVNLPPIKTFILGFVHETIKFKKKQSKKAAEQRFLHNNTANTAFEVSFLVG